MDERDVQIILAIAQLIAPFVIIPSVAAMGVVTWRKRKK